jgi:hypothetical protein
VAKSPKIRTTVPKKTATCCWRRLMFGTGYQIAENRQS